MTALITILISLLGYGSPADYTDYTEDQISTEISLHSDGNGGDLDVAG